MRSRPTAEPPERDGGSELGACLVGLPGRLLSEDRRRSVPADRTPGCGLSFNPPSTFDEGSDRRLVAL